MDVRDYLVRIQDDATKALALLDEGEDGTTVKAGENLQTYLDAGGSLTLEAGATFEGNFVVRTNGTRLAGGQGSAIRGINGPALCVPPGTDDIEIRAIPSLTTGGDGAVVQVGIDDGTQTTLEDVPDGVLLEHLHVPTHRGKRAYEIHGTQVVLLECSCRDVYDPSGRDSQGIWINNTPGAITVRGGIYEAGSENIMIGGAGAPAHIPGVNATNVLFEHLELSRPDSWRTDGVSRKVKALFELKAGSHVTLRQAFLRGCWVDAQTGNAIMLTPRDAAWVDTVLIEDVRIEACVHGLSLLSHDNGAYTPIGLHDLTLRRVAAQVEDRFLQFGGEPQHVTIEDCTYEGQSTTVFTYAALVWDAPDVSRMGYVQRGIKVLDNTLASREYGFMLTGTAGANAYGKAWQEAWPDGVISGNHLHGETAAYHQPNLPTDNTYTSGRRHG